MKYKIGDIVINKRGNSFGIIISYSKLIASRGVGYDIYWVPDGIHPRFQDYELRSIL